MGFDGSGNYTRTNGTQTGATLWQDRAAIAPATISASEHDAEMNDVATALTACLKADGSKTATNNQPMGGFKHTGVADATLANQYATLGQVQTGLTVNDLIVNANNATVGLRVTQTGSGEALRVEDSANPDSTPFVISAAGDVGVGTASPSVKMQVEGRTIINVNDASTALRVTQTGAGEALRVEDDTNPDSTPFVVTATGDVGIGTGSPTVKCQVEGRAIFNVNDANTAVRITQTGAGEALRVEDDTNPDSSPFVVTATGDVGIGTASPTVKCQVEGRAIFNVNEANTAVRITQTGAGEALRVEDETNPDSSPFVITATGNVGVGIASPSTKLTVIGNPLIAPNTGNSAADTYYEVRGTGTADGSPNSLRLGVDGTALNGVAYLDARYVGVANVTPIAFRIQGSEVMRISASNEVLVGGNTDNGAYNLQCNGTAVWGAGAYVNGSDERIKDEITSLDSCLTAVRALNPVTYRYKSDWCKDQSIQPGFIAQEIETTFADKPYLEGLVQQGSTYKSLAYQNLIPILTKALQELAAKVETLEAEISTLKGG